MRRAGGLVQLTGYQIIFCLSDNFCGDGCAAAVRRWWEFQPIAAWETQERYGHQLPSWRFGSYLDAKTDGLERVEVGTIAAVWILENHETPAVNAVTCAGRNRHVNNSPAELSPGPGRR